MVAAEVGVGGVVANGATPLVAVVSGGDVEAAGAAGEDDGMSDGAGTFVSGVVGVCMGSGAGGPACGGGGIRRVELLPAGAAPIDAEAKPVGFGASGCGGRTDGDGFSGLASGAAGLGAVRLAGRPAPVGFFVSNAYLYTADCHALFISFRVMCCTEIPWSSGGRGRV